MPAAKCKTGRYVTQSLGILIKLVETSFVLSPPFGRGLGDGAKHDAGQAPVPGPFPKGQGEKNLGVKGQHRLKPVPLSRLILASV